MVIAKLSNGRIVKMDQGINDAFAVQIVKKVDEHALVRFVGKHGVSKWQDTYSIPHGDF